MILQTGWLKLLLFPLENERGHFLLLNRFYMGMVMLQGS